MIFPGPEPWEPQYPPGTIIVPLHKAPSGHLVMILDDYEALAKSTGGLPESQLQLLTREPEGQTTAVEQAAAEEQRSAAERPTLSSPPGLDNPDGTPGRELFH